MQQDGQKDQPAQRTRHYEARADGHAVKQRVNAQAGHDRVAGAVGDKLAVVGLFAKVEVGADGVFQQVHHTVARHDQNRSQRRVQLEAFGRHLDERGGHQKACAEGDKVAQVALDALGAHQHQSAHNVGQCGDCAEKDGDLQQ